MRAIGAAWCSIPTTCGIRTSCSTCSSWSRQPGSCWVVAARTRPYHGRLDLICLPEGDYDVVGSIVTYETDLDEVARAVRQFLAVPLKVHLCIIDNSPTPLPLQHLF